MKNMVKFIFGFAIVGAVVAQIYAILTSITLVFFKVAESMPFREYKAELFMKLLFLAVLLAIAAALMIMGGKVLGLSSGSSGLIGFFKEPGKIMSRGLGRGASLSKRGISRGLEPIKGVFGKNGTGMRGLAKGLGEDLFSSDPATMMKNARMMNRLGVKNRVPRAFGRAAGAYELAKMIDENARGKKLDEGNDGTVDKENKESKENQKEKDKEKHALNPFRITGDTRTRDERKADEKAEKAEKKEARREKRKALFDRFKDRKDRKNTPTDVADEAEGLEANAQAASGEPDAGGTAMQNENYLIVQNRHQQVKMRNGEYVSADEAYDSDNELREEFADSGLPPMLMVAKDEINGSKNKARPAFTGDSEKDETMIFTPDEEVPEVDDRVADKSAKRRAKRAAKSASVHPGMPEGSYPKDVKKQREDIAAQAREDAKIDWEKLLATGEGGTQVLTESSEMLMNGNSVYGITVPEEMIVDDDFVEAMRETNHPFLREYEERGVRGIAESLYQEYVDGMRDTTPAKEDSQQVLQQKREERDRMLDSLVDQHGNHVGDQVRAVVDADEGLNKLPVMLPGGDDGAQPVVTTDNNGNVVFHDVHDPQGILAQQSNAENILNSSISTDDEQRAAGMPESPAPEPEKRSAQPESGTRIQDVIDNSSSEDERERETIRANQSRSQEHQQQRMETPSAPQYNEDRIPDFLKSSPREDSRVNDDHIPDFLKSSPRDTATPDAPRQPEYQDPKVSQPSPRVEAPQQSRATSASQSSSSEQFMDTMNTRSKEGRGYDSSLRQNVTSFISSVVEFGEREEGTARISDESAKMLTDAISKSIEKRDLDMRAVDKASKKISREVKGENEKSSDEMRRKINMAIGDMLRRNWQRDQDREEEKEHVFDDVANDGSAKRNKKKKNVVFEGRTKRLDN